MLSKKYALSLSIAHVNYQLRGDDSTQDELFVKGLAAQYKLPCYIKRFPKSSTKQDEQTMRDFRYAFFESLCAKHHFECIALGHQKNDQVETFLMNLLRGAGPNGLAAMLPKYGCRIRPLLSIDRATILRYLHARSLMFRADSSNDDTRYTRNRIRHELIPLLETRFNPNIINTIARSAYLFGKKIHDLPHVHTDRVQYSDRSARFSRDDFLSLSAHHQRIWLRTIVGVLSQHAFSLTLQQKNELIQLISGTKRTSGSLTIGPLKLTQKGVTVLLLYTGDL